MPDITLNGALAIVLGLVVAVVLLIPVAAIQYRRDGRFGPGDLVTLVAAAVYGLALWTYTLLPLPSTGDYTCQGRQLELLGSFRPIWEHGFAGPAQLLRDPAFLQVGLNLLLFLPFGFFVRRILRRGVVVATFLGFGMSLLIETTQTTGVWGLYACPYRLFDVDDLMVNTAGALIGSIVSAALVDRAPRPVRLPSHVSLGRRLIGMLCDVVFIGLIGAMGGVAYRAWRLYGAGTPQDGSAALQTLITFAVPLGLEAAAVLLLGKTIGEWTVDLRTVRAGPLPTPLARVVKLAAGVLPYVVLLAWTDPRSTWVLAGFAVITVAAAVWTREHRGVSNAVAGLRLEVDREERTPRQ